MFTEWEKQILLDAVIPVYDRTQDYRLHEEGWDMFVYKEDTLICSIRRIRYRVYMSDRYGRHVHVHVSSMGTSAKNMFIMGYKDTGAYMGGSYHTPWEKDMVWFSVSVSQNFNPEEGDFWYRLGNIYAKWIAWDVWSNHVERIATEFDGPYMERNAVDWLRSQRYTLDVNPEVMDVLFNSDYESGDVDVQDDLDWARQELMQSLVTDDSGHEYYLDYESGDIYLIPAYIPHPDSLL